MEAANLCFGSTCSLGQIKKFQFSQKHQKSRIVFPPLIQDDKISSVNLRRFDWRLVKSRCSALEPKDTLRDVNLAMMDSRRKKLAIFVSGGGSNFRSIHEASIQGVVHGDVAVLVTDKPGYFSICSSEPTIFFY
jgi:hypothetical protein